MRVGVIAEGFNDIHVIKAILKALKIEGGLVKGIRPSEQSDEMDALQSRFSNWYLVFEACKDELLLSSFFDEIDDDALLIVQIDTAERGEKGYEIPNPQRTGVVEWKRYSEELRDAVRNKIELLIPEVYRRKVAYAIAIEETDAWLLPLYDDKIDDTAQSTDPKRKLESSIRKKKTKKEMNELKRKEDLNYQAIAKELKKGLTTCRTKNRSLDLFCIEIQEKHSEKYYFVNHNS
jgi:hypothetical protein